MQSMIFVAFTFSTYCPILVGWRSYVWRMMVRYKRDGKENTLHAFCTQKYILHTKLLRICGFYVYMARHDDRCCKLWMMIKYVLKPYTFIICYSFNGDSSSRLIRSKRIYDFKFIIGLLISMKWTHCKMKSSWDM